MSEFRYHEPKEDKRAIVFWLLLGGLTTSIVTGLWFFMLFAVAVSYMTLRCHDNIENGKPAYSPGKHSRYIQDSIHRLAYKEYGGGYFRKIKRSRYY